MLDIPSARALLARTRPTNSSAGYPATVRGEVVALTQHLVAQGRTANSVARELGLHGSTVRCWLAAARLTKPAFVPVVVAEGTLEDRPTGAAATCQTPAPSACGPTRLTLVSPRGFRLEGLDLDSALVALQRLS